MTFEADTSDRRELFPDRDSGLPQREGDLRSYQDVDCSPEVRTYGMNEPVAKDSQVPERAFSQDSARDKSRTSKQRILLTSIRTQER